MMRGIIICVIAFIWPGIQISNLLTDYTEPMKVVRDWKPVFNADTVFQYTDDSTLITMDMLVLYDDSDLPEAYTTFIRTPVCDDTLCNLMYIQMYWNVLGNYLGYDTIAGESLTKNDHLAFTDDDYDKLHGLLQDDNAVIKRKTKSELFDKSATRKSEVVDAVTGATALEVKEAVVDGALYSCYTLYHLVYGEMSDSILSQTHRMYSDHLANKLLFSPHADYQLFALKNLEDDDFLRYKDRILKLIETAIPLNRIYIMKKMPSDWWGDSIVQNQLASGFDQMDINSRTYVLKKLLAEDMVTGQSIDDLALSLVDLSKNQVKYLAGIMLANKANLLPSTHSKIDSILQQGDFRYSYFFD